MKAHFERFARYNRWANRRLYAAVAQLDSAAFTAPRSGFFPSIAKTLNHLLVADRIWLSRFEGTPNPHRALDETVCASFAALDAARETEDRRLIGFTRSLTAERLGEVLHFRTMAGEAKATPLEVALTHVFNHQTHHRGQAHAMLSGTAVPPPSIDLLYFLPEDAA
jgi:uncharacterized damage-inducible protein DinB